MSHARCYARRTKRYALLRKSRAARSAANRTGRGQKYAAVAAPRPVFSIMLKARVEARPEMPQSTFRLERAVQASADMRQAPARPKLSYEAATGEEDIRNAR